MSKLAENLAAVQARIANAVEKSGRSTHEVRLVAVSKTYPAEAIRELFATGQGAFGESRVQEALPKVEALPQEERFEGRE
jgi:uncharacterized pyridoxal phosphate-containing UPF0001 family protein